jgi:hypothetical protein
MADLGDYKGRPITAIKTVVRKTGDGLSKTVAVDPEFALDIEQGWEGVVAYEVKCHKVAFPSEDRKYPALGGVEKEIEFDAGTAVFLDADVLGDAIARQKERNRQYEDEAAGRRTIFPEILEAEHRDGLHKRLREDCPLCDAEREQAALEAAEDEARDNVTPIRTEAGDA